MLTRNWKILLATLAVLATALAANAAASGDALTITGPQAPEVPENTATVASYTANAPDGTAVTWSLRGADKDLFTIAEGELSFLTAPDYENPTDADSDNVYELTVEAATNGETAGVDVRVTVTDVNEPPTANGDPPTIDEQTGTTIIMDLTQLFEDPEGHPLSFSITAATTASSAAVHANNLVFVIPEAGEKAKITISATDGKTASTTTLTVAATSARTTSRPSAVRNLQAAASQNQLSLTWDAPSYNGGASIFAHIIDYRVEGSTGSFTSIIRRSSSRNYTITGLEPETAYEIKVKACNRGRKGSFFIERCGHYGMITATTMGTNTAPTVAEALPDIYVNPGESPEDIDLSTVFQDADGDTLHYTVTSSDNEIATPTISGTTLSITTGTTGPIGPATISVTARDRPVDDTAGLTATETFLLTVDYLPVITIEPSSEEPVSEADQARFTLKTATAPTTAIEVKICVSQGQSDYLAAGMPSSQCDPTGTLDVTTNRVLATIGFGAGSTSEEFILQLDDDFVSEPNGRITAMIIDKPTYPYTAGSPNAATVRVQDNDTVTLDVEPRPVRHARVSWNLLPQAEGYEMQIQQAGGTWTTPPTVQYGAHDTQRNVNLDDILQTPAMTPLGLAHDSFEFRVRAHYTVGGTKEYTDYSRTIRIVENPLTTPGGRAYVPNNIGNAELMWTPESNATNHTVRYRRLDSYRETIRPGSDPCTDRSQAPPVFHNHDAWPTMPGWPNYEETAQTQAFTGSTGLINGLTNCWLYALQLNYEVPGPTGTGNAIKVFSANDAYVWPSPTQFPQANQQVATYPLFGHHSSRTFNYAVCTHTFENDANTSLNEQDRWVDIINEAFQKWSSATNGFITVAPYSPTPPGACATGPSDPAEPDYAFHMRLMMMTDDQYNEVRMFELPNEEAIFSFPEFKSDAFKLCITRADACVTSFSGYSALDPSNIQQRLDIAEALESPYSPANLWNILFNHIPDASEGDLEPGDAIQSVDISFKKQGFDTLDTDLNGADRENATELYLPTVTRFNACAPTIEALTEKHDPYKAYELAVHEAGHALGLSSFDYLNFVTNLGGVSYHVAHPTIPDSVMNYDEEISQLIEKAQLDMEDTPNEPNCSPHPFDLMAIYALYQNVPR